jgi:hypothetical protein
MVLDLVGAESSKLKLPVLSAGVAGLVSASFASTPMQLVLTQGVVYSLGGTLLYFASSTFLWEWFVERRGLANGIILSGTGAPLSLLSGRLPASPRWLNRFVVCT